MKYTVYGVPGICTYHPFHGMLSMCTAIPVMKVSD